MLSAKLLLPLILTLTVIRGLIYISLFPPWFAPDEPAHFEAIRLIGQENLRPTLDVYQQTPMHPGMIASFEDFRVWQLAYRTPPPLPEDANVKLAVTLLEYYPPTSTGSLVPAESYSLWFHNILAFLSLRSQSLGLVLQVYVLRFVSLLLTVTTVLLGWIFAATIFPSSITPRVAVTAFLVFLPMHLHVNTAINTDVPATFLASLFFVLLAKLLLKQNSRSFLMLGAALVVALLAGLVKPTALFLIPTTFIAGLVLTSRRLQWPRRVIIIAVLLTIPLSLVGAVVVFQIANFGRALATQNFSLSGLDLMVFVPDQRLLGTHYHNIRLGFMSFWGLFGWANLHIPFGWIRLLWLFCFLIAIGLARFLWREVISPRRRADSRLSPSQQDALLVLATSVVFVLISMYTPIIATQSITWSPAGRYLFPALLPLALMLFVGFRQLLPASVGRWVLPLWVTMWVAFDTAVITLVLLPALYG